MVAGAVRKRCVDCKWIGLGDTRRAQWCDRCGGEMRTMTYGKRRKVSRGR